MSTKAEILKRLEGIADDEIIAVPTIKTKLDAEEIYSYMQNEEVDLTAEQWDTIVTEYEDAESYDDDSLAEIMYEVLNKKF
jgi:hypothetical protein